MRLTLALIALTALLSGPGHSQQFATRPIMLVVPFVAGAANDVLARTLADELRTTLGTIVVDNKPGANGAIGAEFVKRAPADGHTLMVVANSFAIAAAIGGRLRYDLVNDFEPVVLTNNLPFFLVVNHEAMPVGSPKEFVDYAGARPGKLSYGSAGLGSTHHLAMELFKLQAGFDMLHVPYKGMAVGISDLLAGRIQALITGFPAVAAHMKSGKLKLLATVGGSRSQAQPQVPTFAEAGIPNVELGSWQGIVVPAGTPAGVIARLNSEFNRALGLASIRDKLALQGMDVAGGTPEAFGRRIRGDIEKALIVVKAAGITGD